MRRSPSPLPRLIKRLPIPRQKINALIGQGLLYNRAKEKVVKKIDGGLIRQDR